MTPLTIRERAARSYLRFEKRTRWTCPGAPIPPDASRHLKRHHRIEVYALKTGRLKKRKML